MRTWQGVVGGVAVVAFVVTGVLVTGWSRERAEARTVQVETQAELDRVVEERDRLARDLRANRLREQQQIAARDAARREQAAPEPAEVVPAESASVAEPPAEAWRERLAAYPVFEVDGVDGGLHKVDWVEIGENMAALPPLVLTVVEHVFEDGGGAESIPPEAIGSIQRHAAPVLTAAMQLSQGGTPGTGVNGAVTHPTVMSNSIAASLDVIGLPLSEQQVEQVDGLTLRFTRQDQKRIAALDGSETALARLVAESDLRRDYFHAVYAVLTPEQNEALRPEITRDRLRIDLFSESLIWVGRVAPIFVADRDDLEQTIAPWVISRTGAPVELHEAVRGIVADWTTGVPSKLVDREPTMFERNGNLHADDLVESARETARLLDLLLTELDTDTDFAGRIRAVPGSLVSYRLVEEVE